MQHTDLLKTLLEAIQAKVSPQVYQAYFAEIKIISKENNSLTLACKNAFTKQVIETRYFETLLNAARKITEQKDLTIELMVKSVDATSNPKLEQLFSTYTNYLEKNRQVFAANKSASSGLNPKYRFNNFIVGSGNQLAHAAAVAIVENPGNAYNPFFVYGGVGLGKTHLMQAIGNAIIEKNPEAKVLYCSTESFLNEMIQSIMKKNAAQFREKYRDLDVLLLDDIQFISNKEALQEEFFNTFNSLYQAGKQIVLASDRPPIEISHLEERIRSRFEGGLVADIKAPNLETRVAIIQNKLQERNEFLPEPVIYALAEQIDSNIRELEGALLKISIYAKTHGGEVSVSEISSILGDKAVVYKKKATPIQIIEAVCEALQVDTKDIKSPKRNYDITYARQLCMFLLKDVLNLQLIKIARHVGRKDHTTVMHGIEKIEKLMRTDQNTAKIIQHIKSKL